MKRGALVASLVIFLGLGTAAFFYRGANADTPGSTQGQIDKGESPAPPAAGAPVPSAASPSEAASAASAASASTSDENAGADLGWLKKHCARAITFGVAFLLTLAITGTMLVYAGRATGPPYISKLSASFFFWLEMGYLVLLLLVGAVYVQMVPARGNPELLGGILPVGVPWFGAVGAVVISLEGIFAYGQKDWDSKYNYWHIGRPLFGAILGIVAFFTYLLIIMSAGAIPPFIDPEKHAVPKDYIVYYIVAFLVGYREETFRELIRRVTDLILKPATASADAPAVTFKRNGVVIANLDFGSVTTPASSTVTIAVENTGKGALKSPSVSLDKSTAPEFTAANDKITGSSELKPGETKSVDLKFAPTVAGASYSGVLTVLGSNLKTPSKLAISGKG